MLAPSLRNHQPPASSGHGYLVLHDSASTTEAHLISLAEQILLIGEPVEVFSRPRIRFHPVCKMSWMWRESVQYRVIPVRRLRSPIWE